MAENKGKRIILNINIKSSIIVLLSVFLLLSVIRSYYLKTYTTEIFKKIKEIKEEIRPANLQFIKIVDSSCSDCFNIDVISNLIKTYLRVNITKVETMEFTSEEAKKLISQYNIKIIPTLIILGEITKPTIENYWAQLNGKKFDGIIYIESLPPYRNLESGKVEGLIHLIELTDSSCSTCYDVSLHKQILKRFGLVIKNESIYDINSTIGREILNKYNITKVPTILLSSDARIYPNFINVWYQVGSIEKDGWLVFRATEIMGTYKDVLAGKIVKPRSQ